MDAITELTPKQSSEFIDLSIIKNPAIREFIAQQLPKLDWLQDKDAFAGLPPIKFNFYFSSHATPEDTKGWKGPIDNADIWFPEMIYWNENARSVYESVSSGKEKPEEALDRVKYPRFSDGYRTKAQELSCVYGRNIPIDFIDMSANEIRTLPQESPPDIFPANNFQDAINISKDYFEKNTDFQILREVLMLVRLPEHVKKIVEDHPEFISEDNINVLLTIGSSHTWIYQMLERHGIPVSREFSTNPQLYGFDAEIFRSIRFGKGLSDELVANEIFEKVLLEFLPQDAKEFEEDYDKLLPYIRRVCNAFDLEEKARIYNRLAFFEKTMRSQARSRMQDEIDRALIEKGIIF